MNPPPVALHILAIRPAAKPKHQLPHYPPDHELGMKVPVGGSDCDKCEHLAKPQTCDEPHFIAWNGSATIPVKTDRYCCDFFDTDKD